MHTCIPGWVGGWVRGRVEWVWWGWDGGGASFSLSSWNMALSGAASGVAMPGKTLIRTRVWLSFFAGLPAGACSGGRFVLPVSFRGRGAVGGRLFGRCVGRLGRCGRFGLRPGGSGIGAVPS